MIDVNGPSRQRRETTMKRNWKLALCLVMALVLTSACSSQPDPDQFPDITQALTPTSTPAPAPTSAPVADEQPGDVLQGSIFDENPYDVDVADPGFTEEDAMAEENFVEPEDDPIFNYDVQPGATPYAYAGSTPIPLDPVDMPTPTPRPDLSFTYTTYTANTLGVTFEAPVSWQMDESQSYRFILSEPQVRDGQQCIITISAEPVATAYEQRDLETHVTQRLNAIGGSQFTEWKPSYTATRHMMGKTGVYANYSGTLNTGVEVGGRIHYVCLDNVLYGVEITFPLGFKDDYIDVFGQIRSTIARQ